MASNFHIIFNKKIKFFLFLFLLFISCQKKEIHPDIPLGDLEASLKESTRNYYNNLFNKKPEFISDGFDYPVGIPDGKGYYNAQSFMQNYHLGDDWNGVGGGDTDYGDTFYAIANGYVFYTRDLGRKSGWGKVIRVMHKVENYPLEYVESMYAHCSEFLVKSGTYVKKGQPIGKIGNADGLYKSHLHFEMRHDIYLGVGNGYNSNYEGYLNPTLFLEANRRKWE